jgi:hypothetical protein
MPQPKDHTQDRGALESLLRKIPGFRGYLEKEYRRESDALQRAWLADRLQRAKRGLDALALRLTDAGTLDPLPAVDRLRAQLDKLIGRIRGTMQGYSGMFDLVRVDEALLDRVYEHDVALMDRVEELAESVEALGQAGGDAATGLADSAAKVQELDRAWDLRVDMLRGLE